MIDPVRTMLQIFSSSPLKRFWCIRNNKKHCSHNIIWYWQEMFNKVYFYLLYLLKENILGKIWEYRDEKLGNRNMVTSVISFFEPLATSFGSCNTVCFLLQNYWSASYSPHISSPLHQTSSTYTMVLDSSAFHGRHFPHAFAELFSNFTSHHNRSYCSPSYQNGSRILRSSCWILSGLDLAKKFWFFHKRVVISSLTHILFFRSAILTQICRAFPTHFPKLHQPRSMFKARRGRKRDGSIRLPCQRITCEGYWLSDSP